MSSGRILIADDEPSVRDSVGYALAQEGFEVTGAADGDEATAKLGDGIPYDLLILDIMMPGPSGLDICRDVRSRSAVPIIVLTAKDAEVDKVVGTRGRRRRLRDQAVLGSRAARPGARPVAPPRARPLAVGPSGARSSRGRSRSIWSATSRPFAVSRST